ncbi:hypothetical protein JCM10212_000220 [Sporobolomyces blumeae]
MHATRTPLAGIVARTRPLPARKQLVFAEHAHLLASNDLVLFLRPGSFSAEEWRAIRGQLADATSQSKSKGKANADDAASDRLRLTLLRPGLLPALLRHASASSPSSSSSSASSSPSSSGALDALSSINLSQVAQASHLSGPLAVITSSTLSPPVLSRVLGLVKTFSRTPAPNSPPPPPNSPPPERLALLSSILERSTAADPADTKRVSTLPELDVLRAQIVGLLGAPGARITGVVGARAREVGRTLEGFKEGLQVEAQQE